MSVACFQSLDHCLHWEKAPVVLVPFALWSYWLVFMQQGSLYR